MARKKTKEKNNSYTSSYIDKKTKRINKLKSLADPFVVLGAPGTIRTCGTMIRNHHPTSTNQPNTLNIQTFRRREH